MDAPWFNTIMIHNFITSKWAIQRYLLNRQSFQSTIFTEADFEQLNLFFEVH